MAPKTKLLDQMRLVLRLKHLSIRTEQAYLDWIKRFIHFHKTKAAPHPSGGGEASGWRHPRDMGAAEVRQFLEHLATDRNVAAPTQDQALNALVFLYHGVLKIKLGELGEYLRANKPAASAGCARAPGGPAPPCGAARDPSVDRPVAVWHRNAVTGVFAAAD